MTKKTRTTVSELYVNCSYPMRPDASDTCQKPASTVALDDAGLQLYRCLDHQGQIGPGIKGPVRYYVEVER